MFYEFGSSWAEIVQIFQPDFDQIFEPDFDQIFEPDFENRLASAFTCVG